MGEMNHGDLHVVLNQPLYQLWLFACNLTAVNSIMYLCKIQLSSVHSHLTFREVWCTGPCLLIRLTKPQAHFNEKWQKTKMKNYVTLNIPQTWHFSFIAQTHSTTDGKKCTPSKVLLKQFSFWNLKQLIVQLNAQDQSQKKKCSHHDYLFISKWCHLNHVYNRKKKNWTVSF